MSRDQESCKNCKLLRDQIYSLKESEKGLIKQTEKLQQAIAEMLTAGRISHEKRNREQLSTTKDNDRLRNILLQNKIKH